MYDNYQKDCFYLDLYSVTYEEYMILIIDKLLTYQDKVDTMDYDIVVRDDNTVIKEVTNKPKNTVSDYGHLPPKFQDNFASYHDDNKTTVPVTDFQLPDKDRGFISLEPGIFQLVGSDREPVTIGTVNKCIELAHTIRANGKPNHQLARYPLKLGLNIERWAHYHKDYPFEKLLQYLIFGFLLSFDNPEHLKNQTPSTHYSASQYKVKVGVLRPVQQPGSYWDRSLDLPLVGLDPQR